MNLKVGWNYSKFFFWIQNFNEIILSSFSEFKLTEFELNWDWWTFTEGWALSDGLKLTNDLLHNNKSFYTML